MNLLPHKRGLILACAAMLGAAVGHAQLAVTVLSPKVTGQKTVVQLKLKNDFTNAVQSARAICFLLDQHGKLVGQSAKWVVGQNKINLAPGHRTIFNFVITSPRPLVATNLTAKIAFSRLMFEDGKSANVAKAVQIQSE